MVTLSEVTCLLTGSYSFGPRPSWSSTFDHLYDFVYIYVVLRGNVKECKVKFILSLSPPLSISQTLYMVSE